MLDLILLLVFGSVFSFLALQNTTHVTVSFLNSTFSDIPLFVVIIGSMISGVFLSYVIYLFHSISTALKIRGKDQKIKESEKSVAELTKEIHQLELQVESLKKEDSSEDIDDKSL